MFITEDLQARLRQKDKKEHIHVIVKTRGMDKEYLHQASKRPHHSLRHQLRTVSAFSLALPVGEVQELAQEPWVERVEHDKKVYALVDTSLVLVGVPEVWKSDYTGKGVRIAVVDTGIDRHHPDFANRVVAVADFTLEGFWDLNGHGSHIAGIIAGSGKTSRGRYKGVAPDAQILVAKVLKADGSGRMSDVMAGIDWAVEKGVDVINLSLGSEGPSDGTDALSELCDQVVTEGVVVCVAAGNDGPERCTIGSPGSARKVITVGASTDKDRIARFSSRGPTLDERLKPEIVAPGVDIVSVRASKVSMGKPVSDAYTSATGTSMSAAHVSGVAALFREVRSDASPQLIKEAILHTAKDLKTDEYSQGAGRINALAALKYIQTHDNPPEVSEVECAKPGCLTALWEFGHGVVKRLRERVNKKGIQRR